METKEKRRFCDKIAEIIVSRVGNYYLGNLPSVFWKNFNDMFPNWKKDPNILQPNNIPVFNCKSKLYDFCDNINKIYNILCDIGGNVKLIQSKVYFLKVEGYIISDGSYYWFVPKNISNTDFWVQFYQKVPDWRNYAPCNHVKRFEVRFKSLDNLHKFISDINIDYADKICNLMNGDFSSIPMPEIDFKLEDLKIGTLIKSNEDLIIKVKKHHVKIFN